MHFLQITNINLAYNCDNYFFFHMKITKNEGREYTVMFPAINNIIILMHKSVHNSRLPDDGIQNQSLEN